MNLLTTIILVEMLGINTYTTYSCSRKKKPPFGSLLSVSIFTIVFSTILFLIHLSLPIKINFSGKGFFVLFGFLYVVPLKFFFDQSFKHMIIIMSSSWIYTTFTFSIATQVAYLFPTDYFIIAVVITQTLFHFITLPYYIKFVNKVFIYILRHIEKRMINSLLIISLSWFFIIFLLNYNFIEGNVALVKFLVLFFMIGNAILSYKMVYHLVSANNRAKELSHITRIDALTQLKNREALNDDVRTQINENKPFSIIFIDLDDFKSINDCYGHAAGDAYLIEFVKKVSEILETNDSFYRLHGDEFVIITELNENETFCSKLKNLIFHDIENNITFQGLSLGYASFPADGTGINELLYMADFRMYQVKKGKHRNATP